MCEFHYTAIIARSQQAKFKIKKKIKPTFKV